MSARTMIAVLLGASLALGGVACGGAKGKQGSERTPVSVRASTAVAEAVELPERIEVFGTVQAERSVAAESRVMASVVAVRVKAGDTVGAGDVLVEIDPQTASGQEAQARGALAQARAALALADRNHQRFGALRTADAASELELDMARMQYEQAKGAVEQGEGAVAAASSLARESRVVAPFAGRIAATMVDPGDLAVPGRPLVRIESAEGRRLEIEVPESLAIESGLAVGARLSVRLDAWPGRGELSGVVAEMSSGADPASHTFSVAVDLPGPAVPTGVTGRAFVEGRASRAVVVPPEALVPQGGMMLVVLRDAEGRSRTRAVTVGRTREGGRVEVLSGLSGGETLLVGLAAPPPDGSLVAVAEGSAAGGEARTDGATGNALRVQTSTTKRGDLRAAGPAGPREVAR